MDLIDHIRALSSRIQNTKDLIQTEEATKNAMVMPFIQILGYNPFDPLEVTPELVADVGTKKGEKVDYAILKDGKPIIIFECKKSDSDLNISHAAQLFRYFHVTDARFAVLTNGITYKFFSDLEEPNKMDETPFFEFNMLDFRDRDIEELKKFAKSSYDLDQILATANDLKYTQAIQQKLTSWIARPPEELVRILASDLLGAKRFSPLIKEQFTAITKRAFEQLISQKINERLKGAMAPEHAPATDDKSAAGSEDGSPLIITTEQEYEGFFAVRAILRDTVSPQRIIMRDAQSYCAVLLDDNNRKPICRLRFNNPQRLKLGFFNGSKEEEQISITDVDEIFNFADKLRATVKHYLSPAEEANEV